MPYINYDKNGRILEIFKNQQYEGQVFVEESSCEYSSYLTN